MFNPSREQVRQFFFDAWKKHDERTPLVGLEAVAVDVILAHPEYRDALERPEVHADREYSPEEGQSNPFLHMSLHLALEEQLSIDQPPGIAQLFKVLVVKKKERHAALHEAIECLAETVWHAQRDGAPPDPRGYLECLERKAKGG